MYERALIWKDIWEVRQRYFLPVFLILMNSEGLSGHDHKAES